MDKISKALKKFSAKEQQKIKLALIAIKNKKSNGYELKKLKGYDNIFRIRTGSIRIIFCIADEEVFIVAVERRSDTTYRL